MDVLTHVLVAMIVVMNKLESPIIKLKRIYKIELHFLIII